MPLYAYKCSTCDHAEDVLQKMSEAPLTICPNCGASTFSKQVTAASFQLKGTGWYQTDFRHAGQPKPDAAKTGVDKDKSQDGAQKNDASENAQASEKGSANANTSPASSDANAASSKANPPSNPPKPASNPAAGA